MLMIWPNPEIQLLLADPKVHIVRIEEGTAGLSDFAVHTFGQSSHKNANFPSGILSLAPTLISFSLFLFNSKNLPFFDSTPTYGTHFLETYQLLVRSTDGI